MQQSRPSAAKPSGGPSLISIVIPVFNEVRSLPLLYEQLQETTADWEEACEFIFVDDGSSDGSSRALATIESADKRVKIIEFSRNFGKEIALTAGIQRAAGQAVVLLDADLQHPVALLPEFIAKWHGGAEVVVGVRKRYGRESALKRFTSWLFYQLLSLMSETPVTPRATDYRLLDRVVVDAFNQFSERRRITRGLIDWLGFRREYVYFKSSDRLYGSANYRYGKLFNLALNSFVSLSLFPLRFAGWLGIVVTIGSGMVGLFMLIEDVILGDPLHLHFSGPAMLAVLNMFWIGIVLVCLGLVALYIANIHTEVVNRPLYVERRRAGPSRAQKT